MKALVIGSEGNIGKPLVRYLKDQGYEVKCADIRPGWKKDFLMADINHVGDLIPAFEWSPDVVFILAAIVSRVTCEQAAELTMQTNLAGLNNVLQMCVKYGAKAIYFSTSEVYGPQNEIMDEHVEPSPNNRYGMSKLLGEKLVEYEVQYHGLKAVTLRPFMMYDENEDIGDHRSAMIRFATNLALGKEIEVHRGSVRGWFHVSDAVRAIEAAAHLDRYEVVNIGNPDLRPIEELAELIRKELGASPSLVTYTDIPSQMTLVKNPTFKKQREVLGVVPKVSLEDGVKRVCGSVRRRLMISGEISQSD